MTLKKFHTIYRILNNRATRLDVQLWIVVLTAMTLDIGLSIYGIEMGLIELNPVVLFGIETVGYAVMAFLKVPAIVIGITGWLVLPIEQRQLVLVGLSLPWVIAVIFNTWFILMHLSF